MSGTDNYDTLLYEIKISLSINFLHFVLKQIEVLSLKFGGMKFSEQTFRWTGSSRTYLIIYELQSCPKTAKSNAKMRI